MPSADTLAVVVVNYGSSRLLRENLAGTAAGLPDAVVSWWTTSARARNGRTVMQLSAELGWQASSCRPTRASGRG